MNLLKKLLCKLFGHKGPRGIPFLEGKRSGAMTKISWDCPRCGEQTSAISIDAAQPTRHRMQHVYENASWTHNGRNSAYPVSTHRHHD